MRNEDKIVPKPPVSQTPSLNKHSATIPGISVHFSSWSRKNTQWPTFPFLSSVQLKFYEKLS